MIEITAKIKQKDNRKAKKQKITKTMANKKSKYRLMAPVFLVGMMGSGKSKIGKMLAEKLAVEFVDSDKVIVEQMGKTINDIFSDPKQGEKYFREKELAVISNIITHAPKNKIMAGGGGAFINPKVRGALRHKKITTVYMDVPAWLLWVRVRGGKDRPLLRDKNPKKKLREIYHARRPTYLTADIIMPANHWLKKKEHVSVVVVADKSWYSRRN